MSDFLGFFLIPSIIVATVICAPILGVEYYGACQEARVYNAEHNTNWTCSDFFWAGEQINDKTQTVRMRP